MREGIWLGDGGYTVLQVGREEAAVLVFDRVELPVDVVRIDDAVALELDDHPRQAISVRAHRVRPGAAPLHEAGRRVARAPPEWVAARERRAPGCIARSPR